MSFASAGPQVSGKFLEVDGRRFLVKGVTYGTFAPDADGVQFPALEQIDRGLPADGRGRHQHGPHLHGARAAALLDEAAPARAASDGRAAVAQHVAFLDDRALAREIRQQIAGDRCARSPSHPAALLFAVGNEIPPAIVRWHGTARVERFLRDLYDECKQAAPDEPAHLRQLPADRVPRPRLSSTSALQRLPAPRADLRAYLARLQHIAGTKPLLLAEAGADSIREGRRRPGRHHRDAPPRGVRGRRVRRGRVLLDRRVVARRSHGRRLGLRPGRRRRASRSRRWPPCHARSPRRRSRRTRRRPWPKVSVVVCAYNAADTIDDCLTSLDRAHLSRRRDHRRQRRLARRDRRRSRARYPGRPRHRHPERRPERGAQRRPRRSHRRDRRLHRRGRARRSRLADLSGAADSSRPTSSARAGPTSCPPTIRWVAQCVARAPGGPTHVLLDDRIAEHVPGLQHGVPPRRAASPSAASTRSTCAPATTWTSAGGCRPRGCEIGFAPSALVWHHHRAVGEGLLAAAGRLRRRRDLARRAPSREVRRGQMLWRGRIYSPLPFLRSLCGRRVNTGVWGTAAFPSVYSEDSYRLEFLPHSPAWMLVVARAGRRRLARPGDRHVLTCACCCSVSADGRSPSCRCVQFALALRSPRAAGGRRPLAGQSRLALPRADRVAAPDSTRGAGVGTDQAACRRCRRRDRRGAHHAPAVEGAGPGPAATSCARVRLGLRSARDVRAFWSESLGGAHARLLTEIVGVLRAARPAPLVEVDEGWRPGSRLQRGGGPLGLAARPDAGRGARAREVPDARPVAAAGQR